MPLIQTHLAVINTATGPNQSNVEMWINGLTNLEIDFRNNVIRMQGDVPSDRTAGSTIREFDLISISSIVGTVDPGGSGSFRFDIS